MTILCGECGHIKSRWDNHDKCIKCSSCSRESTCSTCSSWTDKTWKLAEKRRTCASRKWVMARKKNKKQKAMDEENTDGITTLHGPAAQGRTHPSGNSKGTCTQRSISPLVTGQPGLTQNISRQSITGLRSLDLENIKSRGKSVFTSHLSPVNGPPVIRLYINLHLVILMPWAWSSLLIEQTWDLKNSYRHEVQNPTNNS